LGTVMAVPPARSFGADADPPALRTPILITESTVAVDRVVKGAVKRKSGRVVLSQVGGRSDRLDLEALNDPLVTEGERYLLFLMEDEGQRERPNLTGLPRYSVVGVWSGKAKLSEGGIQFLPAAHESLRKYNGMTTDKFLDVIKVAESGPPMPTDRLRIHPGGKRQ